MTISSETPHAPHHAHAPASEHEAQPAGKPSPVLRMEQPKRQLTPPTEGEAVGEDELLYGDQEDAQSFIQPAISPVATRLMSPKTPASEKAAAMNEVLSQSIYGAPATPTADVQRQLTRSSHKRERSQTQPTKPSLDQSRPSQPSNGLPTPWKSGPRQIVVEGSGASRPALAGIFGQSRHRRSSSGGSEAFKRLSRALPSISIPSNLIPNLSTSSFFSLSSQRAGSQAATPTNRSTPMLQTAPLRQESDPFRSDSERSGSGLELDGNTSDPATEIAAKPPYALRKSTSDDSLLYHSLSRVSSFGDDNRFTKQRDQVNSRFKAIKDSWADRPAFKLPQFPSIFATQSQQSQVNESVPDTSRPPPRSSVNGSRDPLSILDDTLASLTGDIVVMGGYRGSILRSAEPPNRQLWVPVKVGLNIRKVNMEVGLDPEDEENMEKTIYASGMLQNIGPVDISKRLFKKLRDCDNARTGKLRVHDYGYDWRLSPHLLSRKLTRFLEDLPCNQADTPPAQRGAWVIAHSLGGLITRHVVNSRSDLFAGVVYAGTPQRCVNILGPLRNGDAVLLNEKVLTAQVNFSLRTSFALLPEDGFCFVNKTTLEEYPVDFFNPEDWIKYRWSPCLSPTLPAYTNKRSSTFGYLSMLDSLPIRARSSSEPKRPERTSPTRRAVVTDAAQAAKSKDRTLAPQMATSSTSPAAASSPPDNATFRNGTVSPAQRARNLAYLARTLAEVKRFRAETAHRPSLTNANAYPPLAVIYGKETPTLYAAAVACRDAIGCADAYDNLLFRSGDGVVLAREAMLPPGYDLVNGGRLSTDRGHVTMLGDLAAVGKALDAVVRGRRKGIGMGAVDYVAKGTAAEVADQE